MSRIAAASSSIPVPDGSLIDIGLPSRMPPILARSEPLEESRCSRFAPNHRSALEPWRSPMRAMVGLDGFPLRVRVATGLRGGG